MKTCKFLDRDFEFGGTIDHLEQDKGKYKGIYIIVCPRSEEHTSELQSQR